MEKQTVMIKSNAYGLIIMLDPQEPFDSLCMDVRQKFREAARFFRNAQMAVTFKGRSLTEEEERTLVNIMTEQSGMHIVCIVDEDKAHAGVYEQAVRRTLEEMKNETAALHWGNVTRGEEVTAQGNLVVLGDVNPGAVVTAGGCLIILGCCMGQITAGFGGDRHAFAAAIVLKPSMLRIADKAARSAVTKREDTGDYPAQPMIAFIRDDHLVMEKMKGNLFKGFLCSDNTD